MARVVDVKSFDSSIGGSFDDLAAMRPTRPSPRADGHGAPQLAPLPRSRSGRGEALLLDSLLSGLEAAVGALEAYGHDGSGDASARASELCEPRGARVPGVAAGLPRARAAPRCRPSTAGSAPHVPSALPPSDPPPAGDAPALRSPTREERKKLHRNELVERFLSLDENGDGEVTADEFAHALSRAAWNSNLQPDFNLRVIERSQDGLTFKEAKALFASVDENGDGTMDQMEFISLVESRHPLLSKVAWAADLQKYFADDAWDDDGVAWVDPNRRPWLMLSPNDNFRMCWDIATAVLLVEPLRLGFDLDPPRASFIWFMDYICDGFFVADFGLNFRTGYLRRDTGALDMDPKRSALYYCRTWAFLDFISSVPPILEILVGNGMTALRSAKILKLGRVMKLGKMFRLAKFMRFSQDTAFGEFVEDFFASSKSKALRRIFQVLLSFAILAHYLGCMFAVAGHTHLRYYDPAGDPAGGGASRAANGWTTQKKYLASVYWAVTTMTTVGYGDIVPVTHAERVYTMVAMVVGGAFYGYVVAQATCIVNAYDARKGPYYAKMDRIHSWLNYHQAPLSIRRHVRRYYRTYFSHKTAFDEAAILDDLDPESQRMIADHVLPSCIRHNELFEVLPKGALCKLVPVIRLLSFQAGDLVVSEGDKSSSMFIIYTGKVRVRRNLDGSDDVEEDTLQPGGSFGEKAVLGVNSRSYVTARAIAPTNIYIITQDNFMQAFVTLPEALLAMRTSVDGLDAPKPSTFSHLSPNRPGSALVSPAVNAAARKALA
ncbi:voltage-gated potassium channel [Aureococcus anophagefferens]|nr:voltage-gated potassium channel [Aureococcus anophagefferens]